MTAPLIPTSDRPYQLLPPLTPEQRHILRQSIQENGVLEPVVFDEDGDILDGHHRVEIAEELGIEYPRRVIADLDRPGKHMYALTVNVARRQLDQSTRSGLVAQMRIRGMSIREIAKGIGVSRGTVANDLAQVSNLGHLPDTVTGSDGKSYASSRPTPSPGPTGAALSPPADPGATPCACGRPRCRCDRRRTDDGAPETPAPVADAPAPPREPGPTSEPGVGGDLRDHVLAVLRPDEDDAWGLDDICSRLPGYGEPGQVRPGEVREVLAVLVEAGLAGAGRDSDGPYWWKVVPKPTSPPAPAVWTPEQHEEHRLGVQRKQSVDAAHRFAGALVLEVRGMVTAIIDGIDCGAPTGLVTAQMIAECRAALDRLEARVAA